MPFNVFILHSAAIFPFEWIGTPLLKKCPITLLCVLEFQEVAFEKCKFSFSLHFVRSLCVSFVHSVHSPLWPFPQGFPCFFFVPRLTSLRSCLSYANLEAALLTGLWGFPTPLCPFEFRNLFGGCFGLVTFGRKLTSAFNCSTGVGRLWSPELQPPCGLRSWLSCTCRSQVSPYWFSSSCVLFWFRLCSVRFFLLLLFCWPKKPSHWVAVSRLNRGLQWRWKAAKRGARRVGFMTPIIYEF